MLKLKVNDIEVEVEEGLTVLQACEKAGVEIPRFCYHEKLSIAGNCRMCLVEMEKSPKPIASCAMPAAEGMVIKTNTPKIEKSRKGVMEFLLANHPLDCPVCDQGGECDLQDQSMFYGIDKSRFKENKRAVPDKNMGPLIKTQMTRCIHCTRCIRFATEIAGVPELGAIGRGEDMQITTYLEKSIQSELSGNVIDLCPVGALTSKPYVFEARPWELKKTETIDVMDAVGSNIRVDTYDWEVKRVLPVINEDINEEWISDKTRYACDGLLSQRLDTPYIKYNNKFEKASWDEVFKIIKSKIQNTNKDKIAGFVGDLINMEASYIFKEFLERTVDTKNYECRSSNMFIDSSKRENYLFNSTINGIEDSDLILLIGTNPRFEATMLNARIRKAYLKNKVKIVSLNDIGDLTYPYNSLDGKTQTIKDIFENKNELSKEVIEAQKPMVIFGESFLKSKSAKFLFNSIKNFLLSNNKFTDDWSPLNFLPSDAATIGSLDLDIIDKKNELINSLNEHKFDLVFLMGQDNLKFNKKNEFIIYVGSHGDNGAELADIILPGAAYTEQSGHYTNLEGKVQKAYKASYPPGDAKEDWEIINNLAEFMNNRKLFNDRDELESSMFNYINLKKEKQESPSNSKVDLSDFEDEILKITYKDYYFSNVIARSSKTMLNCNNSKSEVKRTGTEG
ncbi:NADH-quinone oxidoreductase subunit NuoG [Candidatus Pelagibacter sp. RS39]|uniref:NADH-quinone oxidoreductase subunit NuoG n=1 Tax=Candidatus Pelagibacter sp. RS39 TaxID=1977864 RepID=UPI000A162F08|nr:NADH-quinone oxidoreductase subunit NuoG [Candidatus Pelagibacter sp. RS39]ARJ47768.1 NADH-quinone oxidoreductase subunit G [Candidatus Pelagibacter sp. RS39]